MDGHTTQAPETKGSVRMHVTSTIGFFAGRRNNVAPAEQFASVPETGPVIEFRPDPATLVAEGVPSPASG